MPKYARYTAAQIFAWLLVVFGGAEMIAAILRRYLTAFVAYDYPDFGAVMQMVCVLSLAGALGASIGTMSCATSLAALTFRQRKEAKHVFWPALGIVVALMPLTLLGSEIAWGMVNLAPGAAVTDLPFFDLIPLLIAPMFLAKSMMFWVVEGRRQLDRAAAADEARKPEKRNAMVDEFAVVLPVNRAEPKSTDAVRPDIVPAAPKRTRPIAPREAASLEREERVRELLRDDFTPTEIIEATGFKRSTTYKDIQKLKETPLGL